MADLKVKLSKTSQETKMENIWDASKIRGLRRRLGWSQSDLARRLSCDSSSVRGWEEEAKAPSESHVQTLQMIFQQAELVALEMTQSAQAEATLKEKHLEFVELASFDLPEKN